MIGIRRAMLRRSFQRFRPDSARSSAYHRENPPMRFQPLALSWSDSSGPVDRPRASSGSQGSGLPGKKQATRQRAGVCRPRSLAPSSIEAGRGCCQRLGLFQLGYGLGAHLFAGDSRCTYRLIIWSLGEPFRYLAFAGVFWRLLRNPSRKGQSIDFYHKSALDLTGLSIMKPFSAHRLLAVICQMPESSLYTASSNALSKLSMSGFCLWGADIIAALFLADHDFGIGIPNVIIAPDSGTCTPRARTSSAKARYRNTAGRFAHLSRWLILGFGTGVIG